MQENDPDYAYKIFIEAYLTVLEPVFLFAKNILGDKEEARDVVIDVFTMVWLKCESFKSVNHIRTFAFKCTRNACYNRLKLINRRKGKQHEIVYHVNMLNRFEIFELSPAQIDAEINRALQSLNIESRTAIELHFFEKLTYEQVAARLGLSRPTVRYRIRKGLESIKVKLDRFLRA